MRFFYCSIFLILTSFSSVVLAFDNPVFGVVDYRVLLAVHPLMAKLNPQTKRFEETISAPLLNPGERKAELEKSAKKILERVSILDAQIKTIISSKGKNSKEAYDIYWEKRNALNTEYKLVCDALSKSTGSYSPKGLTEEETLMPILQKINESIKNVLLRLRKNHKLLAILDSSIFFSSLKLNNNENAQLLNIHWNIWSNIPISSEEWHAMKNSWNQKLATIYPRINKTPFKAGFVDLTSEAVKLLKQFSEPGF